MRFQRAGSYMGSLGVAAVVYEQEVVLEESQQLKRMDLNMGSCKES